MVTSLVLGTALLAPGAPVPQDTIPTPTGPAPHVAYLKADPNGDVCINGFTVQKQKVTRTISTIENGQRVIKQVEDEQLVPHAFQTRLTEAGGTITTADGTELSAADAARRVKDGAPVLVSADGKPVEKGWLRAVRPDTVVIAAESLAATILQPAGAGTPTTAAPRLVLLASDADGKVPVAINSTVPNGYQEQVLVRGGGVMVVNGRAVQRAGQFDINSVDVGLSGVGRTDYPTRPLEDVKFEAYDLDGKMVPRADALRRLKAGGLVLIAGDARLPDAEYLKPFRGDLLVLVSPELALPPGANVRATSGRPAGAPAARGLPVQAAPAQVLPAAPARALPAKPANVAPAGLKVAPAPKPAEEKPAPPAEKNG